MAVTISLTEFAAAIRAGDGENLPVGAERIAIEGTYRAVRTIVEATAPSAPQYVANEAIVRAGGYLYDAPEGQSDDFMRKSGASSLLKRWTVRGLAVAPFEDETDAGSDDAGGDMMGMVVDGGDMDDMGDMMEPVTPEPITHVNVGFAWTLEPNPVDAVFTDADYELQDDVHGVQGRSIEIDLPDSGDNGYFHIRYSNTLPDLMRISLLPGAHNQTGGFGKLNIAGNMTYYRSNQILSPALTSSFTTLLTFGAEE